MADFTKVPWSKEYQPVLVVPDMLVDAFKESYPYAHVIPVSETLLPEHPNSTGAKD